MKITVLDGYTENPGDLSWDWLEALGETSIYDCTPDGLIAERSAGCEIIITNKTPLRRETLEKLGLEEIAADGQAFDPTLHNAVMREDADGAEADTVTEVLQKGYKLGERILRPAMVKVAN